MNTQMTLQKLQNEIASFLNRTSEDDNGTIFTQYKLIRSLTEELSNHNYTNKDYYEAYTQVNGLYDRDYRYFQDKATDTSKSIDDKLIALSHLQQKVRLVDQFLPKNP